MKKDFSLHQVTSHDGTIIGYRQYGSGPGLVLVNGAMGTAANYSLLAETLADSFTVLVPDRRGRGMSPRPFGADYSIQKDVDDLDALLTKTGAHFIYGLSAGAVIVLTAALSLPQIEKVAAFEPPLFSKHPYPAKVLARYTSAMAQGDIPRAMIAAMKAVQLGPALFNYVPEWLLAALFKAMMNAEEKRSAGDHLTQRAMAPTLAYDFKAVDEMHTSFQRWSAIRAKVLLMGAGKSPEFLKADLDTLAGILPQAERITFPTLGHGGSWNYDKQRNPLADPVQVANVLQQFFTD